MKWLYLLIILVIGGALAYFAYRKPELRTDTPTGTAKTYVHAALEGDYDQVRSLCQPQAVASAEKIAQDILAAAPDPRSFKWRETAAREPSLTAVTALFEGRVLTLEMVQEEGEYRIAFIDVAR